MDEEGEGISVHKIPDYGVIPFNTDVKPREEAQPTSDQLVTKEATENGTWTPTRLAANSNKAGTRTGTRQAYSEVATCTPTRQKGSPSEGNPEVVPNPVLPAHTEEAGLEPEY